MDPLSLSASVVGLLGFSAKVYEVVSSYVKKAKNAPQEAQRLEQELAALNTVLDQMSSFLSSECRSSAAFDRTCVLISLVAECHTQIKNLWMKCDGLREGSRLSRTVAKLRWPLRQDECQDVLDMLGRCKQTFAFSLTVRNTELLSQSSSQVLEALDDQRSQLQNIAAMFPEKADEMLRQLQDVKTAVEISARTSAQIDSIAMGVDQMRLRQTRQEIVKFLEWLSPLEPLKRHQDVRATRLENTGTWLLQSKEFESWISANDLASQSLWCPGDPGAGKTVITSLTIDHLVGLRLQEERRFGVACFYYDYRDRAVRSPINVVGAILKQFLLSFDMDKLAQDCSLYHDLEKLRKEGQKPELHTLALALKHASGLWEHSFICIDAIDEVESNASGQAVLEALLQCGAQLFMTGRPHAATLVRRCIKSLLSVQIRADPLDIQKFVSFKIETDDSPELMDQKLRAEIENAIGSSRDGMFLLPALQIRSILEPRTKADRRDAIKQMPTKLSDAYSQSLERICQQPPSWAEQAFKVLSFVTLATGGLIIAELCQTRGVRIGVFEHDPDRVPPAETVLDQCLGLVVLDDETDTARLVHYTLQEYLKDNPGELRSRNEGDAIHHGTMAQICLTYCLSTLKPEVNSTDQAAHGACPGSPTPLIIVSSSELNPEDTVSDSSPASRMLIRQATADFARYAATQWLFHAKLDASGGYVPLALMLFERVEHFGACVQVYESNSPLFKIRPPDFCFDFEYKVSQIDPESLAAAFGLFDLLEKRLATRKSSFTDAQRPSGMPFRVLHWAAMAGEEKIVSSPICQHGFPIESQDYKKRTALHMAVNGNKLNAVKMLLGLGANANARDMSDYNPLFYATRSTYSEEDDQQAAQIASALIDAGAYVDGPLNSKVTPLVCASIEGMHLLASTLLEAGASVKLVDKESYRESVLSQTLRRLHGKYEETIRVLIRYGATLEGDHSAAQCVCDSIEKLTPEFLEFLVDEGLDFNACFHRGNSMLHYAASSCQEARILSFLMSKGLSVKSQNIKGNTPLLEAAETYNLNALRHLFGATEVDRGASNHAGERVLHILARELVFESLFENEAKLDDALPCLEFVLQNRADLEARTKAGETALDIARGKLEKRPDNCEIKGFVRKLEERLCTS